MTDHDKARLMQTLTAVYTYYEKELTKFAVTLWLEDLEGFPINAIEGAFTCHRRDPEHGRWLPKSADVLRHLTADAKSSATEAWANVFAQVSSVGRYSTPKLTQAEADALRAIGGWARVCNALESEAGFLGREFQAAYRVTAERNQRQQLLGNEAADIERLAGSLLGRLPWGTDSARAHLPEAQA
jgi:hypothetical protein